jgi:hypothetical protein
LVNLQVYGGTICFLKKQSSIKVVKITIWRTFKIPSCKNRMVRSCDIFSQNKNWQTKAENTCNEIGYNFFQQEGSSKHQKALKICMPKESEGYDYM